MSRAAAITLSTSRSNPNSGVWTPITVRPCSWYLAAHSRTYGSVLSQFTHVYVQNCTATTRPRSPSGVSGSEVSHPVAPSKGGPRSARFPFRPPDARGIGSGRSSSQATSALAVRGQELGQRRHHLLGSLLGDPVAGVGDDHGLHVVRGGLHPVPGLFTPAFRSADRQDGHCKRPVLALRVLCKGGVQRAVQPETAAQDVGVGVEVEVVLEDIVGQALLAALDGELVAEEDVLASPDELFGYRVVDPVEGEVPELVVDRLGETEQGR